MMKTATVPGALRSTSNSQQAAKLKKSVSGTFASKVKAQVSATNSMLYSIKQNRPNTSSKSNKKSHSNTSNKSFKALTDSTTHLNIDSGKKPNPKRPEHPHDRKPTPPPAAIPVKSIKQKIIGKGINESTLQTIPRANNKSTAEKENEGEWTKKIKQVDRKLFPIEPPARQSSEQSLLNFSCLLPREEELHLSQFEVGRKLGRGRFGDVYMARDSRSGLALAIKMINKKEVKQAQMQAQLAQQIKIQLHSCHPNILKMYGFFHDQHKIYLLLELATNGCLFKQIRQHGHFEESLASFYFRQVSSGVRYLHGQSVIHRDIKPENILNCFNVLKLCDFGWAIYSPIYQRQTFCGTLDYVPPEIVTGEFYDEKADLWCLGVLCYELCTGKAPFESKTDENETYDRILKVHLDFPAYLSPQLVDFVSRLLHRDPAKRMSLQEVQAHEWMRRYENQSTRLISKDIWQAWIRLARSE